MRKGICLNLKCKAVNRLPKGWKVAELRCGKCGDAIRGTVPASAEQELQPVTMAEAAGPQVLKPDAPPPPLEDVPEQLKMFAADGRRHE